MRTPVGRRSKVIKAATFSVACSVGLLLFNNCSGLGQGFGALTAAGEASAVAPFSQNTTPPAACDEASTGGAYRAISGPTDLITVDMTHVVRRLCPEFWGVNDSPAWDALWGTAASAAAVSPLNFTVGRYWGGSGADWINWTGFPNAFTSDFPIPTVAWNTIAKSGIKKLIIQTNPTILGGNDPSGAPVAQAMRYFNANAIPIFALEIGNEQDNTSAQDALSTAQYADAFTAQCSAAKGVDPGVACMGPASTNDWFWWPTNGGTGSPDTLEKFLAGQGDRTGNGLVDKISLHWYPGYDLNKAQGEFLQVWPLVTAAIQRSDSRDLPVYFTEFSASSADAKNPWMGTAIEAADLIEAFKLYGVGGVDYFTIHQVAGNWGFLQGSAEAAPNSPTATYYALYLAQKMGANILDLTQGQPRSAVSSYAAMDEGGDVQVMVINKTSLSQPLRLAFNGFDPTGSTVSNHGLVGGSESQTSVSFNGTVMPAPTALPAPSVFVATGATIDVVVEAFSVRVLNIHRAGP